MFSGFGMNLRDIILELRPRQWTKNLIVLAAFIFALGDKQQHLLLSTAGTSILAMILFAAASSGVYVWNDICDRERDRVHPVKKNRPVAAGRIRPAVALVMAAVLIAAALLGSFLLNARLGLVILAYIALQGAYTHLLKHVALVDVFVIAFGFVLRAVAGAVAISVVISPWLLICTFLMALFLALCKRRHEKRRMDNGEDAAARPSLQATNERLLDQLIAVTAGAVIVAYAVYTQWPETVAKFQTTRLSLTIPFVVFGIFRYLHLVYNREKGDQPESILLTDLPLIASVIIFGFAVIALVVI